MACLWTIEGLALPVTECVRMDDLVGTGHLLHDGTGVLLTSAEVHQTE